MKDLGEPLRSRLVAASVRRLRIDDAQAGQRLDHFVARLAKGVPKSHVFRIIRAGEVRVNRKRVDVGYRLATGDEVRLPPLRITTPGQVPPKPVAFPILYEDADLLAIDKPSGVAVHGGSGISAGVIEQLRALRPGAPVLELVHRLDRDTSG